MPEHLIFNSEDILLETIINWKELPKTLELSAEVKSKISNCRSFLEQKIAASDVPYYGINTGFGDLCNEKIADENLNLLQRNLLLSHSCGTGDVIDSDIIRLMIILKVKSLCQGHSGICLKTVELLVKLYNKGILPEVFENGSLGASGDLVPLAHMSLMLIGEGDVQYNGKIDSAKNVLSALGLKPIELASKEGLALLNGTQFMLAHGLYVLRKASKLFDWSLVAASMSIDGYSAKLEPFSDSIHKVRRQVGQIEVAKRIRKLLEGSEISASNKEQVQDPYSFRCVPQVLGACLDVINNVSIIFENEINAVTDNPIIFPEEDSILSGGNFHGEPLALNLDYLALALSEIGNISERRIYRLLGGKNGLPKFLIKDSGLNSGLMIPQYTAASLVNQNKQLCSPNSVDSIESSNGQEDHVSMGANSGLKLVKIVDNLTSIIAIELMCATQAIDLRRPKKSSVQIEEYHAKIRAVCSYHEEDRLLKDDIDGIVGVLIK